MFGHVFLCIRRGIILFCWTFFQHPTPFENILTKYVGPGTGQKSGHIEHWTEVHESCTFSESMDLIIYTFGRRNNRANYLNICVILFILKFGYTYCVYLSAIIYFCNYFISLFDDFFFVFGRAIKDKVTELSPMHPCVTSSQIIIYKTMNWMFW